MPRRTRFQRIRQSRPFLLIALTVFVLLLVLFVEGIDRFNAPNATQLMMNFSYLGLFVTAMACLLMSGGFDFSLAAQATLGTLIFVQLSIDNPNIHWIVFAILAIVIGACMGAINAFFSQVLNLMPFIATIAISSVWLGISNWWTGGLVKTVNIESFSAVATGRVFGSPIPWVFIFMLVLVVLYSLMLKYTRFGRSVIIAGGNQVAARLAGLNPKKIKTILYINASVLGMIAGLVYTSYQKTATVTGISQRLPEMRGLTSSMLGGVSFAGGSGALTGALFGLILIETLAYSLQVMGLPAWFVLFVNGMLLVVALTIDTVSSRIRMRKMGIKGGGGGTMMMPGMSR